MQKKGRGFSNSTVSAQVAPSILGGSGFEVGQRWLTCGTFLEACGVAGPSL